MADACRELIPGDLVEAFFNNTLVHRGPVIGTAPESGLVRILDTLTGGRPVLDLGELEIVRIPARHREVRVRGQRP